MYKILKIILLSLLILAIILNLNWLKSPIAGIILGLPYFLIFGYLLGKIIFKSQEFNWQIILGIFSLLSVYSLISAIIYYFYQLNQLSVSILFTVISITIIILDFRFQNSEFGIRNSFSNLIKPHLTSSNLINLIKSKSLILTITYLILFAIAIYTLFACQTSEAIRSPWQIIPRAFFIIYFLATLNLLLLLFKNKATSYNFIKPHITSYNLILISLHFFLTTSIALIIYKLGYGFDPFIHQVTESAIFKNGFILPKPFYYLGQYSIVVILAYLFQISTDLIDKLLLPILLSVFLPYIIYKNLEKSFDCPSWPWSGQKNLSQILSLPVRRSFSEGGSFLLFPFIFLLLPFGLFIVTTPQALANLFVIIILSLSFLYLKDKPGLGLSGLASAEAVPNPDLSGPKLGQDRQIPFWYLIFLTLCTLLIHAISGIPILIYLIILWLLQNKNKATRIILPIFILASVFALPLSLLINSIISIYKVKIEIPQSFFLKLPDIFSRQYHYFLDLAYLYKYSIYGLFIIITLLTLYNLYKNHKAKIFLAPLYTFVILIINAILLNFIQVSFIIYYEQSEFANRIFQLSFYFLLPIVIYGLYLLIKKTSAKPFIYKSFIIIIFALALTLALYLSYPRFDDYDNSKFINVSQADFAAVNFIETNAHGQNYIVLSNQMTSAAALKIFGFSRYYNGNYFYAIPTGGPLYKYFETMIYQSATKQTMEQAMDYAGVKTAYFVLPTYWSHFTELSAQAQKDADAIYSLEDKIMIFKYTK